MGSNYSTNTNKRKLFCFNFLQFEFNRLYHFDAEKESWGIRITYPWDNLQPHLRNQAIQDFINDIYYPSYSFDKIFALFYGYYSWYWKCPKHGSVFLSRLDRHRIAEDVLRYAFVSGLQYRHRIDDELKLENLIDLPLNNHSVCECSGSSRRPLYSAVYHSQPDIIRLLLNCGAKIPLDDICKCVGRHPLIRILDDIKNRCLSYSECEERCIVSLKILLVDLPHTTVLWKVVSEVLYEISGGDYKVEKVPALKYITRTQIRLFMKSNRSFCKTHVFEELGVPKPLVPYINIEEGLLWLK